MGGRTRPPDLGLGLGVRNEVLAERDDLPDLPDTGRGRVCDRAVSEGIPRRQLAGLRDRFGPAVLPYPVRDQRCITVAQRETTSAIRHRLSTAAPTGSSAIIAGRLLGHHSHSRINAPSGTDKRTRACQEFCVSGVI